MNISAPFIQRPIATSLLMLLLLLLGVAGYLLMPIAALPQVELPTIQISTDLPGASAEVMATSVSAPLERQLALISGVTELSSTSALGNSSITIQFDISRNIDAAAQDVQAAINSAAGLLPRNLPNPPTYEKANPADFQIMSLAVTSDTLPLSQLNVYADTYIAQRLSRVQGVGLIDLHGEQKPAVRVQIDPNKLSSLQLSLEQVRAALGTATVNEPKGTLDGPQRSVTVDSTDQITRASDYDALILAYRNGAPIRVRDVGQAIDGVEDIRQAAWVRDHRAIIVDIHKQPGFNVVETVDQIKQLLPELERSLPASVEVEVVNDRTQTIRAALREIQRTLAITAALVVLVVFVFLRGVWVTLIPASAIPLSILGTFAVMYVLGYSVDNLSLMAITIAVGFVVDDAIVVIENIVRHVEGGEAPLSAAINGARQVAFTVASMTLSLIAALIPLLFMGGVAGRLFREFSVTVSVALLVSAVVSLTVTPMLCRIFLPLDRRRVPGRLAQGSERAFQWLLALYDRTLAWVLARSRATLALTLAILVLTVVLYTFIPKGFFPQQDTGQIIGTTEAPLDISVPEMSQRQLDLVRAVKDDPDVQSVYSWIGPPVIGNGRLVINLKPFRERRSTAAQVMSRLKRAAAGVSGIQLHMRPRQDLQIGGRASSTQFQYTLQDVDLKELYAMTPKLIARLSSLPQLADVTSDLQDGAPRTTVIIDRDRASTLGINPQVIDDTLYDALGQRQVATIFTQIDQYRVVLEVDPAHKLDAAALQEMYVPSASGRLVPMAVFTRLEDSRIPLTIGHQDQFPAVTLSFNLANGVALGDAVNAVEAALARMTDLPVTLRGSFEGTAQAFKASLGSQPYLILAAILAVYIVLGVLYESYVHPITILSTIPSAGIGALLALMLFGYDLSLISLIGIILLIGIVKKNAIMMVDVALESERRDRMTSEAAIRHACHLRFRPIMMTTGAAILGALPLALGTGAGSEVRAPLGVAIVGGLLFSQFLTLYTTPVVYLYIDRVNRFRARGWAPAGDRA
jgi:hydrophobe/amphiphile efflux-1 (HAE1) family protein